MSPTDNSNDQRLGSLREDPQEELPPSQAAFAKVVGQMLALTWHRQHSGRTGRAGEYQSPDACRSVTER